MPLAFSALHLLDAADAAHLVQARQAERPACVIGAAGSADAVQVGLRIGRNIDIHDRFEPLHVQAARGHIGRHQHRTAAVGEADQHLVALALVELAVQRKRLVALRAQHLRKVGALRSRVAEGQGGRRAVVLEQQRDGVQPLVLAHLVEMLADRLRRVLRRQRDALRLAHEARREAGHLVRQRGREEQRLTLARTLREHIGNGLRKPHVEHAVGLVEHEDAQRCQAQARARQVVEHASGRADDHVRAVRQARRLVAQRHATAQGEHLHVVFGSRQASHLLRHLVGKFAGRAQHERLDLEAPAVDAPEQGQREGGRLAAAGLGLRDDIGTGQRVRQRRRLHRRHLDIAQAFEVGQHRGRERERAKAARRRRRGWGHGRLSAADPPRRCAPFPCDAGAQAWPPTCADDVMYGVYPTAFIVQA